MPICANNDSTAASKEASSAELAEAGAAAGPEEEEAACGSTPLLLGKFESGSAVADEVTGADAALMGAKICASWQVMKPESASLHKSVKEKSQGHATAIVQATSNTRCSSSTAKQLYRFDQSMDYHLH